MTTPTIGQTFIDAATNEPASLILKGIAYFADVKPAHGPVTQTKVTRIDGSALTLVCAAEDFNAALSGAAMGQTFVDPVSGEPTFVLPGFLYSFEAVAPEEGPVTQTAVSFVAGANLTLNCTPAAFNSALSGN